MELFGPIIEFFKCVVPPLYKHIQYHRKVGEYKETFDKTLEELVGKKNDIEMRLETECNFGQRPKKEVTYWLKNAHKIIDDAKNMEMTDLSRASAAKLFEKMNLEAKSLYEKGSSFTDLVIDDPEDGGIMLPTTSLVGKTAAQKNMEMIWSQLLDIQTRKIGIFGMGGVGKTTLMTHVQNKLIEKKKFELVLWVTVSQALNVYKIQHGIASTLKRSRELSDIEDIKQRAGIILNMLRRKRFVLILDDVWKAIRLEEVGIPEPNKENGCKFVIITRSLEVCQQMGCKPIKVMPLLEDEALELFLDRAELDTTKFPHLKETVELVVQQCAGLPLAIVTVASCMKGEYKIEEWRSALKELSENIRNIKISNMEDDVFAILKFSYDRLNNENVKLCFLYCALYPEDFNISKEELVDCWIREGFVDEVDNLEAKKNRCYVVMKKLINNCLLLESYDYIRRDCVKLHDVVRDMILKYIESKKPLFMVNAGLMLENIPDYPEWKENVEKVSLMKNRITAIPSSMSPNCASLSTLLLQDNPLNYIPECFFVQMPALKILDLSSTSIKNLPDSISELRNLTALLLHYCTLLEYVPSLENLQALKELDLGSTNIREVPRGMEMLTNLESLNLLSFELHKFPTGVFSKLCRLETLQIYWGSKTERAVIEEATRLKKLSHLEAKFDDIKEFNGCVRYLNCHQYALYLSPHKRFQKPSYSVEKIVAIRKTNICERERSEDTILLPKDAELLHLHSCNDVSNISDIPTFNTLKRLKFLHISDMENLSTLLEALESPDDQQYSHLEGVHVFDCSRLKKMFSFKVLSKLNNLCWIEALHNKNMKELIAVDDDDGENKKELFLPELEMLTLDHMLSLESICGSNGVMVFDSLQTIEVSSCHKMKKLISTSKLHLYSLQNLESISIRFCELEEIIVLKDVHEEETQRKELIHLPKLTELALESMSKLKNIIKNGILECKSLRTIEILHCPQLKNLPIHLPIDEKGVSCPPPALQHISISREQWEALEWDHPQAKSILLPYCTFI